MTDYTFKNKTIVNTIFACRQTSVWPAILSDLILAAKTSYPFWGKTWLNRVQDDFHYC